MDDKTLHDILMESEGFDLKSYDSDECSDAISIWTDALNIDKDFLQDILMDAIEELVHPTKEDEYGILANRRNSMLSDIGLAYIAFMNIDSRSSGAYVTSSKARRYSSRCLDVGEAVVVSINEWVTDYVEENGPQWFVDVMGYAGDMEEDDGDWAYEQMKDRKMEERE
jgi:hypothetical protein